MKPENIEIWEFSVTKLYDAFFEELRAEELSERYEKFEKVTSFFIALTASGSAFAGWSLWNEPDWKMVWVIIAVMVSILSIGKNIFRVPGRIKELDESHREFMKLRLDIENFRQDVELDRIDEIYPMYVKLRERYNDCKVNAKKDDWFEIGLINKVNKRLIEEKRARRDL